MYLTPLFITWLVCALPFRLSTNIIRLTQTTQISTGDYAGTWIGHTATSEFKLVLEERKNYRLPNGRDYDIIVGRHSFITKGSDLRNESLSNSPSKFALLGMLDSRFPGQLSAGFTDDVNYKSVNVRLSFVDDSKTKLLWHVTSENEVIISKLSKPGAKLIPGISVPTTLTLEKVK
jgi:hypothetical protein